MRLLNSYRKLRGSSLVESVIAIAIISICVLVTFLVYLNVIGQNKSVNYYIAKHKVELLTQNSMTEQDYENDVFEFEGYTVQKDVAVDKQEQTAILLFTIKTGTKEHYVNKLIPYYE